MSKKVNLSTPFLYIFWTNLSNIVVGVMCIYILYIYIFVIYYKFEYNTKLTLVCFIIIVTVLELFPPSQAV